MVYLLKFNWFEQKKVHFIYSKQNLRPKNCLLEIGASNLEGPQLKFQYSKSMDNSWISRQVLADMKKFRVKNTAGLGRSHNH